MLVDVDRSSSGDVLRAHLDPVLAPYGFTSSPGQSHQQIFCAPADDLARRLPALPWDRWDHGRGHCTDLVVDVDESGAADSDRTLAAVRLEGDDLGDLLAANGLHDRAVTLRGTLRGTVEEASPVLAELVAALLEHVSRRVG